MKNTARAAFLAALLSLIAGPALAQNVPANTVQGRLAIPPGGGPVQAIPFSVLAQSLFAISTSISTQYLSVTRPNAVVQLGIAAPNALQVVDGSAATPAFTNNATMAISRYESCTLATCGDGSLNPGLLVTNVQDAAATSQTVGITGLTWGQGNTDTVAVYASADKRSGTGAAFGVFGSATVRVATGSAIGANLNTSNLSGSSYAYASNLLGLALITGSDLSYTSTGAVNGTTAILIRGDHVSTGKWNVGIGFNNFGAVSPTSVADIQTDSSATTILLANSGAHTNGINLSGASSTYSNNAFMSPGFAVSGAGAITGKQLSILGSTSGNVVLAVPAIAGTNTLTFPAGTTDFSATGGTSRVVKQTTAGGAFTVAQLAASDLSNGTSGSGAVALVTSPAFTTPSLGAASATSLTITGAGSSSSRSDGGYQYSLINTGANPNTYGFAASTADGSWQFNDVTAGAFRMGIGLTGGVKIGNAVTGGYKGDGTLNAVSIYQANVQVATLTGSETLTTKTFNTASNTFTVNGVSLDTSWATYTPTITASSGTFTTVSATGFSKQIGKIVLFRVSITITTNGTAAGRVQATLPVAVNLGLGSQVVSAFNETSATALAGAIVPTQSTTQVLLFTVAGAYPGGSGVILNAQGAYEVP